MKAYIYISTDCDAWRNMACDEWFLANIGRDEILLYLYVNGPSVIIGKNQNPWRECDLAAMDGDRVQLARRVSGGGAVFHDEGNLNFSFIAHKDVYSTERQLGVILNAVRALGIPARFSGRNDILTGDRKFSGNAFSAYRDGCLHHGTLLIRSDMGRLARYLQVSPLKMRSKGIESVRSRVINLSELQPGLTVAAMSQALKAAFEAEYGSAQPYIFPDACKRELEELYEKHSSWQWRLGRAPDFQMMLEERFIWGGIELHLSLKEGHIQEVKLFSDALDTSLPDALSHLLCGCPLTKDALLHKRDSAREGSPLWDILSFLLKANLPID